MQIEFAPKQWCFREQQETGDLRGRRSLDCSSPLYTLVSGSLINDELTLIINSLAFRAGEASLGSPAAVV